MRNIYTTLLLATFLLFGGMSIAQNTTCNPSYRWSTSSAQIRGVSTTGALQNISNTNTVYGNTQNYTASHKIQAIGGNSFNITVTSSWNNGIWVDWDQSGNYNNSNEQIASWSFGSGSGSRTFTVNVPNGLNGLFRLRVLNSYTSTASGACNSYSYGDAEDYALEVFSYQNSAYFSEVISPRNPTCSSVSQVEVRIGNLGTKDLTSLEIGGVVKSLQFGTIPLTTANWTGTIPRTSADTATYIPFTYSAGFQIGDTLTMWVANPNGFTDTLSSDDTVTIVMSGGVSGAYTVGDTIGGANDFASINEAVLFLDSVGAVCDTTYIYLEDSIIWNEQFVLSELLNMSETAPVIFTTKMGAAGKATITHNHSSNRSENYTVQFGSNASYYIFDNLNIYSGSGSSTPYLTVLGFGEGASNNTVTNCNLSTKVTSYFSTTNYAAIVSNRFNGNNNPDNDNNSFLNNRVEYGSYGFYFFDGGDENHYEGNTVRNPYYMGFYSDEAHGASYIENTMISSSTYTSGFGIYIVDSDEKPFTIERNIIHPEKDEWPRYGIRTSRSTAKANDLNVISNNSISIGQPWSGLSMYGIYLDQTGFTNITNNSIAVRGSSIDGYGMYLNNGGATRVHNNSVANFGAGPSVRYNGSATVISSSHNNLYATGFIFASYNGLGYSNMADWMNKAGYDVNSVNVNPSYYESGNPITGLSDLHACNSALDAAADSRFSSAFDIDGDPRDQSTPDIGIDEFVGLNTLDLGTDIKYCPGDSVTLSTPGNLTGNTIIWNTGSTNESITVATPGMYSFTLRNSCGAAQDSVEISYPEVVALDLNDTLICQGDMITANANLSNASYNWSNGETSASIMIDDEGEYILNVVDQYGCPSADTLEVMISENAALNTQASDTILCPGQFLSLESGVDPRTGVVYTWSGYLDGSTKSVTNVLLGWGEAATLVIEVNDNSCVSYDTLVIDNAPAPVATFTSTQLDGRTFNFSPDSTNARFQYNWNFGDRTTSTMESPTKLYQTHGAYSVSLVVTTLCGTASDQGDVETIAIGISEELANQLVKVYPNPSSGLVNIQLETSEDVKLEVTDINGKVIFAKEYGTVYGTTTQQVDLSNLASGIYTVRVNMNDASVIKKLTIE